MKRFWVVTPSKYDVYHWADGRIVLGPDEEYEAGGDNPRVRVYCMDLNKEASNFIIPISKLRPWHKKNLNRKHCYCLRD